MNDKERWLILMDIAKNWESAYWIAMRGNGVEAARKAKEAENQWDKIKSQSSQGSDDADPAS